MLSHFSFWKRNDFKFLAILFFIIFTLAHSKPMNSDTVGGLEQWLNLTNSMLDGSGSFMFSYGPLYWLTGDTAAQFSESTYWLSLLFISAVTTTFWFFLIRLTKHFNAWVPFFILFFLYLNSLFIIITFFLWAFLIVVYQECVKKCAFSPLGIISLGLISGLFFYLRFYYGVVATATIGSYLLSKAVRAKDFKPLLIFSGAAVLSFVIFGLMIFHTVTGLKDYIVINSQLSLGNTIDMTYDNVLGGSIWFAVAVIFVATNLFLIFNYPALILAFNGIMLISIKLAFGRADHYYFYFILPVSVVILISCFSHKSLWRLSFFISLAAVLYIANAPILPWYKVQKPFYVHEDFDLSPQVRAKNKYHKYKLPDSILKIIGNKTIDVYPYNNEYSLANSLNYKHRPSFQNYMTLTPTLDSMNVKFLEGTERPQFILWHAGIACMDSHCNVFDGIDGKYSLNEDPMTSLAIMQNYHYVTKFTDMNNKPVMLLEKNEKITESAISSTLTQKASFNQWIDVPLHEEGILKIVPEFKLTTLARVKNMLYRGGVLYVHYMLMNGEVRQYRLNILNSVSGVVASPLLDKFPFEGNDVIKVKFTVSSSDYFKPQFEYAWSTAQVDGVTWDKISRSNILTNVKYEGEPVQIACQGAVDIVKPIFVHNENVTMVEGWLTVPFNGISVADKIFIHGTDSDGKEFYVQTLSAFRPDVGNSFNNPDLNNSGFRARFISTHLRPKGEMNLVALKSNKMYVCANLSFH